jgi:hypothetical protein
MLFDPKHGQYLGTLEVELRRARGLTPELVSEVMAQACGCFAPHEDAATRGIGRLIEAGACVDAVLALIALALPQWKLRRVLYEDGEWHCSLSRQPQLPIELDEVAEGSHEALALAVLIAFLNARRDPPGRARGATGGRQSTAAPATPCVATILPDPGAGGSGRKMRAVSHTTAEAHICA